MPKLARLYLDTARLGPMSPSAQLAARDFARLAGEGLSTLYFQKLLRGQAPLDHEPASLPGLAGWTGIEGVKAQLRRLVGLPPSAPVLFASRGSALMRWGARQVWKRCRRVLVPDTTWPPYARILEEDRSGSGGVIVPVAIRESVQSGQVGAHELVAQLAETYLRYNCDGLFFAAVSHDGVCIPASPLLAVLSTHKNVRCSVIDGAQELAHVPINLTATACDIWLGGAHKWLGGHQPLGIACLPNADSSGGLHQSLFGEAHGNDDPLLRFLLFMEGHSVCDVRETVNIAPLFSTWGALRDISSEHQDQCNRFQRRLKNTLLVRQLAVGNGWKPMLVSETLATGIVVLTSQNPCVCQMETAFENVGVSITALEPGRLRLSIPASRFDDGQQDQLARALITANGRTTRRRSGNASTGTSDWREAARNRLTAR